MVICTNFIGEIITKIVKVGVIVFPGSNCDRDMFHVLTDVFHLNTQYFWHEKGLPDNIDAIILPGGFSYGDRLRAGVIAANSPVIDDVKKLAKKGIPVLGVCNGFQILVESNLLPGVLLKNDTLNFMCQWTNLIVKNNKTSIYKQVVIKSENTNTDCKWGRADIMQILNYYDDLKKNNQIVFTYQNHVNGSAEQIAGVCNEDGNVVGMMPHPERATESLINPLDNKPSSLIFESLIDAIGVKN